MLLNRVSAPLSCFEMHLHRRLATTALFRAMICASLSTRKDLGQEVWNKEQGILPEDDGKMDLSIDLFLCCILGLISNPLEQSRVIFFKHSDLRPSCGWKRFLFILLTRFTKIYTFSSCSIVDPSENTRRAVHEPSSASQYDHAKPWSVLLTRTRSYRLMKYYYTSLICYGTQNLLNLMTSFNKWE